MCGGKGSEGVYGAADGTLTVGPGAAFDCNGYIGHAAAKLVLAGGEVVNSRSASSLNDGWFADVTLTADSFADGATVRIDVGERQPVLGDQLVSWPTKPVGAKNATFAWNLDLPLHAKGKGLFVMEPPGMAILIR